MGRQRPSSIKTSAAAGRVSAGFLLWAAAVFITGTLCGFGVNLAVGNPDDASQTASSQSAPQSAPRNELEKFTLQTDTRKKEVNVQIYGPTGATAPQVQQSGRQVSILLPTAHLSKSMIDKGLPVVTDNHNSLVGRAVPGANDQASIVIPNLPDKHYKVKVTVIPAESAQTGAVNMLNQAGSEQENNLVPLRPKAAGNESHASTSSTNTRAAVTQANQFETIIKLPASQAANKPWSKLRPVLTLSPSPETAGAPEINNPGINPQGMQTMPQVMQQPGQTGQAGHVIWNPFVSGGAQPAANSTSQSMPDLTRNAGQPRMTVARPDPFWYLHQLNNSRVVPGSEPVLPPRPQDIGNTQITTSSVPLSQVPDLTKSGTENAPTNTAAATTTGQKNQTASGNVTFDKTFFAGLKELVRQIPIWVYILAGLFIFGVGMFTLLSSLVLLQQIWQQARASVIARRVRQRQLSQPQPTQQEIEELQRARAHQQAIQQAIHSDLRLQDTSSVNSLSLLKETPTSMKQAVANAAQTKMTAARKINSRGRSPRVAIF